MCEGGRNCGILRYFNLCCQNSLILFEESLRVVVVNIAVVRYGGDCSVSHIPWAVECSVEAFQIHEI